MGKNYKWLVLALLSGAFFFHQADRALFGLLTIPIQDELGLTDVQIGWINTALSWTLAAMATVAGPIGDRLSRKWLITGSLIFWSLMTVCMGFVGDWRVLGVTVPAFFVVMFFRSIATGGGESFYGPSAMALLASHHRETRSVALSIHQAALYVGLMTSGVLAAWALGFLGTWRHVFMAFGAAGLCLGILFVFALRDKAGDGPAGGAAPRESPLAGVRFFFSRPSATCAMAGFVAIVFVNNAYLFWAPKFMALKFGTSVADAGAATMFWHHLFAFLAIIAGGLVTDRFVGRMPRFRLGFQIVAMLAGAPCLAMIGFAPAAATMIAMTAAYGVCRGFFEVNTHASLFDVIPSRYRSTSVGIFTLVAFLFGGLSGVVMGALSQRYGVRGFEIGFALMGGAYVLGALSMAVSFFFTFRRDRIAE
ncbi:MAG: MFS transporter [Kiritimatiellae bacterium]|nr:MFS transporter [Kiritimatiellia bacterium]